MKETKQKKCCECGHELCPICDSCHNPDCPQLSRPTSSCWDLLKQRHSAPDDIEVQEDIKKQMIKITDDKGNEHKVGEIFDSETVTIEDMTEEKPQEKIK